MKLGGTGDFPRGKLNDADEGGLRMAVYVKDRTVMVDFGKKVAWLGLDADTAEKLANSLLDKVRECRK
jgi:hypothetical protein